MLDFDAPAATTFHRRSGFSDGVLSLALKGKLMKLYEKNLSSLGEPCATIMKGDETCVVKLVDAVGAFPDGDNGVFSTIRDFSVSPPFWVVGEFCN